MKQKDWTVIIVAVVGGGIISILLSNVIISPPKSRTVKVEVVEKITSDFILPSKEYFNKDAINSTKIITIGTPTNPKPF